MMVNKKKAAEAAVLHHDLCTLRSSKPAERFVLVNGFSFPSWIYRVYISRQTYSLIDETVTFTWVWTTCLLCMPEKVQVYVPECSSVSGLWSRRDPSPRRSTSWFSSAWPSHRLNVCLFFVSYLKMTVGSLDEVKVQVREKFWRACGAMQGMDSAWPSSCVIWSERQHISIFLLFICLFMKMMSLCNQKRTLVFPRGSPHFGLVSRYERAEVGIVGEMTQNPQRALHS